MKLFYIFGAQRQRSQWEWTTWSVLLSLPIGWLTDSLAPEIAPRIGLLQQPAWDVLLRLGLAISGGLLGAWVWRRLKRTDHPRLVGLRRALTDSAWDEVMDDAVLHERWLEVVTTGTEREVAFRGWLSTAGREDNKAEPWVYLRRVQHKPEGAGGWREMAGTHGLLIHRDQIDRIRVFDTVGKDEPAPTEADTAAASE